MAQAATAKSEMTPREYRDAVAEFLLGVGPKAEVHTSTNSYGLALSAGLYSKGLCQSANDGHFRVEADTFTEVFRKLTAKWTEYEAQYRAETIRMMALAIIRITAELGECTDAALRNCAIHFSRIRHIGDRTITGTLCNRMSGAGDDMDTGKVTCKLCIRELASQVRRAA